jgi:formylglycine-generating enzyme required for sulfatase activity
VTLSHADSNKTFGDLLTFDNLLKINRLSWFIDGKLPAEMRPVLMDWLTKNHPSLLKSVRAEWQKVLDQNPPPADSLAADEHRLQVVLNELLLDPSKKRRRELEKELERLLPITEPDALVVEYLNRPATALDVVLPEKFRKFVKNTEGGYFDQKQALRQLWWQIPAFLVAFAAILTFNGRLDNCVGTKAVYNGQTYCIVSAQDSLTFLEQVFCDSLPTKAATKPMEEVGDTLKFGDLHLPTIIDQDRFVFQTQSNTLGLYARQLYQNGTGIDSMSFLTNRAISFYNRTVLNLGSELFCSYAFATLQAIRADLKDSSKFTETEMVFLRNACSTPDRQVQTAQTQQPIKQQVTKSKPQPRQNTPPQYPEPNVPKPTAPTANLPNLNRTGLQTVENPNRQNPQAQATPPKDSVFVDPFAAQMVLVRGGTFRMGCDEKIDGDCEKDEQPVHRVTLSDFYIGKYEVTEKQWRTVMRKDASEVFFEDCDDCPVTSVSWNDVQVFLQKLNEKTGKEYRLPTETEWEYAARGGNQNRYFRYSGSNNIDEVAWYDSNSGGKTHTVGTKKTNALGIYDMSGNVSEWCSDRFNVGFYILSDGLINPQGPLSGESRVLRGGSWDYKSKDIRVVNRGSGYPDVKVNNWGFRIVLSVAISKN